MTRDEIKNLIVSHIDDVQGCKAIELVVWYGKDGRLGNQLDILEMIDELIEEKRIVEVSYALAKMNYREKSFYLPGKTLVQING